MREAQNFFKHAKDDPNLEYELDSLDTESIAFFATLNLGELGCSLTNRESVFQLWYLACNAPELESGQQPYNLAIDIFGDLRGKSKEEQQRRGSEIMSRCEAGAV